VIAVLLSVVISSACMLDWLLHPERCPLHLLLLAMAASGAVLAGSACAMLQPRWGVLPGGWSWLVAHLAHEGTFYCVTPHEGAVS
jgi:hypothetical protein